MEQHSSENADSKLVSKTKTVENTSKMFSENILGTRKQPGEKVRHSLSNLLFMFLEEQKQ